VAVVFAAAVVVFVAAVLNGGVNVVGLIRISVNPNILQSELGISSGRKIFLFRIENSRRKKNDFCRSELKRKVAWSSIKRTLFSWS